MEPSFVTVQGRRLEYRRIASSRPALPTLVFLHEGLGSVRRGGTSPIGVAATTGCGVLVHSRYGYGRSDVLERAHRVDYMHRERSTSARAARQARHRRPLPVGHSDGGSIALIYAGARHPAKGLALLAPHVFVEDISVESIAKAKQAFETTDLPQSSRATTSIRRRPSMAERHLASSRFPCVEYRGIPADVRVPILAIQGQDDEYGTMRQVDAIAAQAGGPVELVRLAECAGIRRTATSRKRRSRPSAGSSVRCASMRTCPV